MTNIPKLPHEERVYKVRREESRFMLSTVSGAEEHCMNERYRAEVYEARNHVVHAYAGTFSISKACMLLPRHRRFMGCKVDPICMNEAMKDLILFNARQVLSRDLYIDEKGEICSSAEVYAKAVEAIEEQKRLNA